MRYGIVSDIHANLEALETALDSLGDVDALICQGDIVGYGPNPNECCDIIRERNAVTVLGNHDAAAVGCISLDLFNPYAREAIEWTRDQLTDANRDFLHGLPMIHRDEHFIMVHGSLNRPEEFEYIVSSWEARPTFAEMDPYKLCLISHTHIAEFYFQQLESEWADQVSMVSGGPIDLKPDFMYIINTGSVGQPRDFNPKAGFGVYDTDAGVVEIRRLEYPIEVTQAKMRGAGLPEPLWDRLEYGT